MNFSRAITLAALSTLTAFGAAHAGEADPQSQFALQIESTRTRAEVRAEAVIEAATHSQEPAGSRVLSATSTANRDNVRAQAAEAVRTGQIPTGEIGYL